MSGEADPTAEKGKEDADEDLKGGQADPTADPDIKSADADSTGDKSSTDDGKNKADPDSKDQGKDWEASYKGLQPKYQALVEGQKAQEDKRLAQAGLLAEAETTIKTSAETLKTMSKSADADEKASKELQGTIDGLETKLERQTLIMSEYPHLAAMEAKGLLPPDLEGDALKEKLDSMSEILKEQGVDNTGKKIAGSTGTDDLTSGTRSQGDDIESISQKIMEANKQGDGKESARLTVLLIAEQQKAFEAAGGRQTSDMS